MCQIHVTEKHRPNERYSARPNAGIGRLTVQPMLLWTLLLCHAVGHDLDLFNMTSVRRHV
jgi:hypothetical protein